MPNDPKVSRRKVSDLTPDPQNANLGTERGLRILDDSIAEAGLGRSVVVDKNGVLIAGNKTAERALDRGIDDAIVVHTNGQQLVVVQRDDLDLTANGGNNPARKMAFYDNRAGEVGLAWDAAQIAANVEAGLDLGALWTPGELDVLGVTVPQVPPGDPGAAIDRAEELQRKYGTERGQVWIVGRHRVMCGDSYNAEHIAQLLNGQKPAMLHTDPPYGINIVQPRNGSSTADSGGAKPFGSTAPANRTGKTAVAERNSGKVGGGRGDESSRHARAERVHVQHGTPSRKQLAQSNEYLVIKGDVGRGNPPNIVQSNLYPVIEGDDRPFDPALFLNVAPVVIMWGANYYADRLPSQSCWIVWDKRENITRNNFADCELAWTNQDSPARIFYHLWNGLHKGSQHGERRTHPTEKPVALFEEIGRMYADKGLWLDLFAGTGAQIVAAERSGATCYAMEYEPLYVATILERLAGMGLTPERLPS